MRAYLAMMGVVFGLIVFGGMGVKGDFLSTTLVDGTWSRSTEALVHILMCVGYESIEIYILHPL